MRHNNGPALSREISPGLTGDHFFGNVPEEDWVHPAHEFALSTPDKSVVHGAWPATTP